MGYTELEEFTPGHYCPFCGTSEVDIDHLGKIYKHRNVIVHYFCMLLSSQIKQRGKDTDGILGFMPGDIKKEVQRGSEIICCYCKKPGATIECAVCFSKYFHLPCGRKNHSLHEFFGHYKSYCSRHREDPEIPEIVIKNSELGCVLCHGEIEPSDEVIWPTCCRNDTGLMHRNCCQRMAIHSGYFLKCPLCNNTKPFRKLLRARGIFVPNEEASWERDPGAYNNQSQIITCEADKCVCEHGRDFSVNNTRWYLEHCYSCGTHGIHRECLGHPIPPESYQCTVCSQATNRLDNQPPQIIRESPERTSNESEDDDTDNDCSSAGTSSEHSNDPIEVDEARRNVYALKECSVRLERLPSHYFNNVKKSPENTVNNNSPSKKLNCSTESKNKPNKGKFSSELKVKGSCSLNKDNETEIYEISDSEGETVNLLIVKSVSLCRPGPSKEPLPDCEGKNQNPFETEFIEDGNLSSPEDCGFLNSDDDAVDISFWEDRINSSVKYVNRNNKKPSSSSPKKKRRPRTNFSHNKQKRGKSRNTKRNMESLPEEALKRVPETLESAPGASFCCKSQLNVPNDQQSLLLGLPSGLQNSFPNVFEIQNSAEKSFSSNKNDIYTFGKVETSSSNDKTKKELVAVDDLILESEDQEGTGFLVIDRVWQIDEKDFSLNKMEESAFKNVMSDTSSSKYDKELLAMDDLSVVAHAQDSTMQVEDISLPLNVSNCSTVSSENKIVDENESITMMNYRSEELLSSSSNIADKIVDVNLPEKATMSLNALDNDNTKPRFKDYEILKVDCSVITAGELVPATDCAVDDSDIFTLKNKVETSPAPGFNTILLTDNKMHGQQISHELCDTKHESKSELVKPSEINAFVKNCLADNQDNIGEKVDNCETEVDDEIRRKRKRSGDTEPTKAKRSALFVRKEADNHKNFGRDNDTNAHNFSVKGAFDNKRSFDFEKETDIALLHEILFGKKELRPQRASTRRKPRICYA